MGETRCEAKFYPVGQGLFYSAILSTKVGRTTRHFSVVYDCGTITKETSICEDIKEFKKKLSTSNEVKPHKVLDLLVISHFHDDHVNYIPELLKRVHVKTVMIPFCTFEDRILNFVSSDNEDQEVQDLLLDPVRYFQNNGAEQVITYSSIEDEQNLRDYWGDDADNKNRESNYRYYPFKQVEPTSTENGSYYIVGKPLLSGKPALTFIALSSQQYGLFTIDDPFDWEFRFTITKKENAREYWKIKAYIKKQLQECKYDQEKLLSKENIANIRKKYEEIVEKGRLNENSLVCSHFPKKEKILAFDSYCDYCCGPSHNGCTLLPGDCSLTEHDWKDFFSPSGIVPQEHAQYFLVPHHGANNEILCRYVSDCIVCYGIRNTYGHPAFKTMEQLYCRPVYLVNETTTAFSYTVFSSD